MVNCGPECLLPRPFSIHQIDNDGNMSIFYAVRHGGKGTRWLEQRQPGDTVDIFGPLGNGFTIAPGANNLLLIAGGNGIAPIYYLAQEAGKQGCPYTLIYGTADNRRYQIPSSVTNIAITEDGSIGMKGLLTDVIPDFAAQVDQVFACGPMPMYREMARNRQLYHLSSKPVQVSLEVRMACGRSVCYGCTIKTKQGMKQVCHDGPVFDLDDIIWDELTDI